MYDKDLYEKWVQEGCFGVDNDRLKTKKYIFSSLPLCDTFGFQKGRIRPLVAGDILARYERLQNKNVLFPLGCNTLSNTSFIESRRTANRLDDKISEQFTLEMKKLGIGINEDKFMDMRHSEYLSNLQLSFIELYEHGYIEYKTVNVYKDEANSAGVRKIYDSYFYPEQELTPVKAFVLKLDSVVDNIISDIDKLALDSKLKDNMKAFFMPVYDMELSFKLSNGEYLVVKLDNPEFLGSLSYIFINPKIPDLFKYVDINEYESIKSLIANPDLFAFTGFTVINPLTGEDVPVFISNVYENEMIHLGLPVEGINPFDFEVAANYELELKQIIDEDGKLINSDFLDGMELTKAREVIKKAFMESGAASFKKRYSHTEVLISQSDHFGALFPYLCDSDVLYSLRDYLPYYFSVQFRPVLDSKADVPGEHMAGSMNSLFTVGMAPFIAILYDELAADEPLFSKEAEYELNKWLPIDTLLINKDNYFNELFMPIAIHNILKRESKIPPLFKSIKMYNETLDFMQNEIKRSNNNLLDMAGAISENSADSIRLYSMCEEENADLIFSAYEIADYKALLDAFVDLLSEESNEGHKFKLHSFITRSEEALNNRDIHLYAHIVRDFLADSVNNNEHYSYDDIVRILVTISPILPFTAESCYLDITKSRYTLLAEGWKS